MNHDPSAAQDLDRRIDAALRRRFQAPDSLDTLARRMHRGPSGGLRRLSWLALAAAAAVLIAFLLRRGATRETTRPPAQLVASAHVVPPLAPSDTEPAFCNLIGPVREGAPTPGQILRPDLVRLYRDMDTCQRDSDLAVCWESDLLAERMSATYDQPLDVRPEAAGHLRGPFGSDEWPTGTIVTGSSEQLTSVVVADRDTTLACCLHMSMPEGSGLRLFTRQVGDVVLTEITPFEEPRLLAYFE